MYGQVLYKNFTRIFKNRFFNSYMKVSNRPGSGINPDFATVVTFGLVAGAGYFC